MVRNFSPQIPEGIEDSAWCRVPPGSINNAEAPNCLQKSGVQGAGARHQAIPQDARGQLGAKISPTDFAEEPNILDRFHIVKKLNEAVDKVRKEEFKRMKLDGYDPILTKSKYCLLKRPDNLTPNQKLKLDEVLQYDLKSTRAYMHKEAFDAFWQYNSPYWARWFLKKWCTRVMRSRLEPMKKFVKTLRNHEDLLMNYFKTKQRYSSGIVEGLNRRINLSMRKAYGYKSFDLLQVSLFHQLGDLPEPEFTHRFC